MCQPAAVRELSGAASLSTRDWLPAPAALLVALLLSLSFSLACCIARSCHQAQAGQAQGAKPGSHQAAPAGTLSRLPRNVIEYTEIHDPSVPMSPPLGASRLELSGAKKLSAALCGVNTRYTLLPTPFPQTSNATAPNTIHLTWCLEKVRVAEGRHDALHTNLHMKNRGSGPFMALAS
jgi:hypothetical protein